MSKVNTSFDRDSPTAVEKRYIKYRTLAHEQEWGTPQGSWTAATLGLPAIPETASLHLIPLYLLCVHLLSRSPAVEISPPSAFSSFAAEHLEPFPKPPHDSPDVSTLPQQVLQRNTIRKRMMTASPSSAESLSPHNHQMDTDRRRGFLLIPVA